MSVRPTPPNTPLFHALWKKQGGLCGLCDKPMPQNRFDVAHATLWKKLRPSFDHIIPRAAGGPDRDDNLQLAHTVCNKIKGKRVD